MLSTTFTYTYEGSCTYICIVGTVNRPGYDSQLKQTICDACRPCHSILSILKPVYHQLQHIRCTYESLRCLDLKIWRYLWMTTTTATTTTTRPITLPLAHAYEVKITIRYHEINSHEINSRDTNSHKINFSQDQFPYDQPKLLI